MDTDHMTIFTNNSGNILHIVKWCSTSHTILLSHNRFYITLLINIKKKLYFIPCYLIGNGFFVCECWSLREKIYWDFYGLMFRYHSFCCLLSIEAMRLTISSIRVMLIAKFIRTIDRGFFFMNAPYMNWGQTSTLVNYFLSSSPAKPYSLKSTRHK